MAFNLDDIFVDQGRAEQGVWVPCWSGSRLKLAYSEGKRYKTKLAKLYRQHRLEIDDTNEESWELAQAITAQALAECVLLDWEGIVINGEERPYSKELAVQVLMNYPKLRDFVVEKSAEPATFREGLVEKVKKS